MVDADRERSAQAEADMATYRWAHACGAEGGGGPLCRPSQLVRGALDTEAALATRTADDQDRREAVTYVAETEATARASAAKYHADLVAIIYRDRVLLGAA